MNYIPVIGLEIHIQSKTKSKMFCGCSANYFGAEPNTHTCPVCLGLPGALPVINKKAIENCIKLAIALNCEISELTKFDRKNYFYPDLPKGYQISQYDMPIGRNGYVEISGGEVENDNTRIRITRVHQEEDTAKSIHFHEKTAIDCNKSGVALIEVVTEPDFETTAQITEFAKKLQQLVRYIEVSDANMEMGQMRFELNISVKKPEEKGYPKYKVECKNISSISILEKVVNFEIKRQSQILEKGEIPVQETRGIDDKTGETFSQRIKEDSEDYRYFPEPDLPLLIISKEWEDEIKSMMGELPSEKLEKYVSLGLPIETATLLSEEKLVANWFEEGISFIDKKSDYYSEAIRQSGNFIIGELFALLKKKGVLFSDIKILPKGFNTLIIRLLENKISGTTIKSILDKSFEIEIPDVDRYIEENELLQISDPDIISKVVNEILESLPKVTQDYKAGKLNAKSSLVGKVMGIFKGKANPQVVDKLIEISLNKL